MTPIVLFDGDCHFCNSSVQFIIKHDHKGIYYFAPLQSKRAQVLLEKHQISFDINSLVLIENDKAFIKSYCCFKDLSKFTWNLEFLVCV